MSSYIGRPENLVANGAYIPLKLWVPEYIAAERRMRNVPAIPPIPAAGMIDTGAYRSAVDAGVAKRLGLTAVGSAVISTPSDENIPCDEYYIQLQLPQGFVADVLVNELPRRNGNDRIAWCILGRDVLQHGLLIYNGITSMYSLIF
jgi:hypothetical protein